MVHLDALPNRRQHLWPGCPPGLRPDLPRRLRVRRFDFGFFNPSLEGGFPLLRPRRRSSSSMRSTRRETCFSRRAFCCRSQAFSSGSRAFSSSRRAIFCAGVSGDAPDERPCGDSGLLMSLLSHFPEFPSSPSRQFRKNRASTHWSNVTNQTTWAVTKDLDLIPQGCPRLPSVDQR